MFWTLFATDVVTIYTLCEERYLITWTVYYFFFLGVLVVGLFYYLFVLAFDRYVAQYNDMPSPLSNEKLAESRRNEELRKEREREREREEASKAYHERDTRLQMSSQQRKGRDID